MFCRAEIQDIHSLRIALSTATRSSFTTHKALSAYFGHSRGVVEAREVREGRLFDEDFGVDSRALIACVLLVDSADIFNVACTSL